MDLLVKDHVVRGKAEANYTFSRQPFSAHCASLQFASGRIFSATQMGYIYIFISMNPVLLNLIIRAFG